MWLIIRAFIIAVLMILIILFAYQNQAQTATVEFLKWKSPTLPLFVLLMGSFSLGVFLWFIVSTFMIFNLKRINIKTLKEKKGIQAELERLRNVEIEEETASVPAEDKPGPKQLESNTTQG
jgi:uncharacterized integral membrane protein